LRIEGLKLTKNGVLFQRKKEAFKRREELGEDTRVRQRRDAKIFLESFFSRYVFDRFWIQRKKEQRQRACSNPSRSNQTNSQTMEIIGKTEKRGFLRLWEGEIIYAKGGKAFQTYLETCQGETHA